MKVYLHLIQFSEQKNDHKNEKSGKFDVNRSLNSFKKKLFERFFMKLITNNLLFKKNTRKLCDKKILLRFEKLKHLFIAKKISNLF